MLWIVLVDFVFLANNNLFCMFCFGSVSQIVLVLHASSLFTETSSNNSVIQSLFEKLQ